MSQKFAAPSPNVASQLLAFQMPVEKVHFTTSMQGCKETFFPKQLDKQNFNFKIS